MTIGSSDVTFCFDMRGSLEDGSHRVTRWPATPFKCFARKDDGTLYVGNSVGVGTYDDYLDEGEPYTLRYYSNPLTFGDSSRTKMLKKITPTVIAGGGSKAVIKWGYDFSQSFSSAFLTLPPSSSAEYGLAEYNIDEYSANSVEILKKAINATGNGTVVTVGIEAEIDAQPFSLQEFNIQALLGRII
jgi:hypothetical protein